MEKVYFDNATTAFPKAPGAGRAMQNYIENFGGSTNRGQYADTYDADRIVFDTRTRLAKLFASHKPTNVVFTMNVTQSLNFLLKGLLRPGDHCVVSSMEHNAVMRPLYQLGERGVSFSCVPCDAAGRMDPGAVEGCLRANTKVVAMTHASNVCGTILPAAQVGEICRRHGVAFILDAAQTAGVLDIPFDAWHLSALAFTGHKGLLGPQGVGGFLLTDELAARLEPLISGGTGSQSHLEQPPPGLPDRFEPGTPNLPGIIGLNHALRYLRQEEVAAIRRREQALTQYFLEGLQGIDGVSQAGPTGTEGRLAVVSIRIKDRDCADITDRLQRDYGILTRCGLHCAPMAHRTLGTYPEGTVRFSFGCANDHMQVDYALAALRDIVEGNQARRGKRPHAYVLNSQTSPDGNG